MNGKLKFKFDEHKMKIKKIIIDKNSPTFLTISEDCTAKLIKDRYLYETSTKTTNLLSD